MVDDMRFNYSDLNPDLIMDAIDLSGLRIDSGLIELNSYENRVYQFQDEDRRRYVVKFYRPGRWSRAQILEEHAFAARLCETEIPVAAPIAFAGETLLEHQGYPFAIWQSVGGVSSRWTTWTSWSGWGVTSVASTASVPAMPFITGFRWM
jgi:Ser/Thr protein kinase RdoA (MazF antagonist)